MIHEIFFDVNVDTDYLTLLIRLSSFVLCWIGLLYSCTLLMVRIMPSIQPREIQLRIAFLWALGIVQLFMSLYLFFLLRYVGLESLQWKSPGFYLAISPQLLLFFTTIFLSQLQYSQLKQIIRTKSSSS